MPSMKAWIDHCMLWRANFEVFNHYMRLKSWIPSKAWRLHFTKTGNQVASLVLCNRKFEPYQIIPLLQIKIIGFLVFQFTRSPTASFLVKPQLESDCKSHEILEHHLYETTLGWHMILVPMFCSTEDIFTGRASRRSLLSQEVVYY